MIDEEKMYFADRIIKDVNHDKVDQSSYDESLKTSDWSFVMISMVMDLWHHQKELESRIRFFEDAIISLGKGVKSLESKLDKIDKLFEMFMQAFDEGKCVSPEMRLMMLAIIDKLIEQTK